MKTLRITSFSFLTIASLTLSTPEMRAQDDDGNRRNQGRERISRRAEQYDKATAGHLERADKLIGTTVFFAESQGRAGRLEDLVVDLESGRTLYAIISTGEAGRDNEERSNRATREERRNNRNDRNEDLDREDRRAERRLARGGAGFAVPASALRVGSDGDYILQETRSKFESAPRIGMDEKVSGVPLATEIYKHYSQSMWWNSNQTSGDFGNAHRLSNLVNARVVNVSNDEVGTIDNLVVDVPGGRILYVVMEPTSSLNFGNKLFAMPPNAFTRGSSANTLVTNVDRNKLADSPNFARGDWPELNNYTFASRVYQHYGKKAYFDGQESLSPTSENEKENDRDAERRRRNRRD